jgi:hypothetical protein
MMLTGSRQFGAEALPNCRFTNEEGREVNPLTLSLIPSFFFSSQLHASTTALAFHSLPLALVHVEPALAEAVALRRHLDELVFANELDSFLQGHALAWGHFPDVCRRGRAPGASIMRWAAVLYFLLPEE